MTQLFSDEELKQFKSAQTDAFSSPVPTQIISNGEFTPTKQTEQQKNVENRIKQLADELGKKQGLSRRQFLTSASGMAAAFLAMNDVFGPLFMVNQAEAAEPERAMARANSLQNQFIFDDQTHFVHDEFKHDGLLNIPRFAADHWEAGLTKDQLSLSDLKFQNYIQQVFLNSDTKIALLSGAPFDDPSWWFLANDQIRGAVETINKLAGSRRMYGHFVITPKQDGWLDKVNEVIETGHTDSWKAYTIGDPLTATTQYPWRLDDEKLMYPFYEKAVKAGIRNIAIHKGLLPADYEKSWPNVWQYASAWDIGKAAKDWPQMNFIIYHACLRPAFELPDQALAEFEATGEIKWASDLARIPEEYGVSNVYADLGTCFANSATANPRFAAALLGTLIKGLGVDHVVWGTDSVWYGSPQWQIEALRRLEIPEDMQKKHGFAPLGPADGAVKNKIFGLNSAKLYNLDTKVAQEAVENDGIAQLKQKFTNTAELRDNARYGYIV
ncbi:MAG: putative TIM-barrel fold metal-dependent hydrolase [Gammaproteobacteria bacterium]|jgi:predicted TIM-barrel fold metal-dependent hydrolase